MIKDSFNMYSNQVWLGDELCPATICIEMGKIAEVVEGHQWSSAIDFSGQVIMPGAIDAHVHINEPGRTDWEGFETATKAAAKGGITTLVDMPLNSSPVVTNVKAFYKKIKATNGKLFVNCGFWAGAVDNNFQAVEELIVEGCLGLKVFLSHSGIDEFPNITIANLDDLMKNIKKLEVPVLAHCEFDTLPASTEHLTNPRSYRAYLNSRPKTWENEAIKSFIGLCEKHRCKAHIVHLASDEMVDWIAANKKRNLPFTVETCPHYLLFHAEEIEDRKTLFKCAPPIREKMNSVHLREALKSGIIDFISSDHSPAPPAIKEMESGNFTKAWGGIAGLQFLLSASWTALKNEMSLKEFIPLLTAKPAAFLGLGESIGEIAEGYDADLTVWNPKESFVVNKNMIEHRHKISPYEGWKLYGTVDTTFVNGKVVYRQGHFGKTACGKRIHGKKKIA